jgi:glyoxylase-like metal-dependent hydrolase (beta-lactamase superfamily II)
VVERLAEHDIALVLAGNPGPFTLSGTNTWIVGHDPCWVVDPGPELDEHVGAVVAEVRSRGGAGGIALTHDHADHSGAAPAVREMTGAPVWAVRWEGADRRLRGGEQVGPFEVVATPGHAADHVALVAGTACCTGDAVLGEGSVFVAPGPGALAGYLDALRSLRSRELDVLLPGHGPLVADPAGKLDQYVAHRLDRERRLLAALDDGLRTSGDLLDRVWNDAPAALRVAASVTLAAHLEKLEEEGRLPDDVERPDLGWLASVPHP